MTREEFGEWLATQRMDIYVDPYVIAPCSCGDINCKGWRLLPAAVAPQAVASTATAVTA